MNTILDVRDLYKSFRSSMFGRRVQALNGISFSVAPGECFGILGKNGAGKTTTLKILTGQLAADRGEACVMGASGQIPASRRRLGYLPENPYFHEHLTPLEGLELFGRLSGLDKATIRERSEPLLERVGMSHAKKRRVRSFSKGMRQRYGLAAALISEPELLLLDEPLSGLDPHGRRLVKELVLEEREKGKTVVLCSHVLGDVQEMCDRVVVLHEGSVVRQGNIHELLDQSARGFELCASEVPEALVQEIQAAASRFFHRGEDLRATFAGAEAGPEFAAKVAAAGGRISALVPERETLEAWFVRLTKEAVSPMSESASEAETLMEKATS